MKDVSRGDIDEIVPWKWCRIEYVLDSGVSGGSYERAGDVERHFQIASLVHDGARDGCLGGSGGW